MSEQETKSSHSKKSPLLFILLILALVLVVALVFLLKQCSPPVAGGGETQNTVPSERELIPSQTLVELSAVAANRGAFGVQAPDGDIYLLQDDVDGKQSLIDIEGNVIYEFDTEEKIYIAGISDGRVLLVFTSPDTQFTDPRQTWEGVQQHYALSVGATNLGLFTIIHSEEDVQKVLSQMNQ